ncbi:aldehyde dehydrogenase family protein [Mesorhizobium sp. ES1-6]|uniref:aldehyde dehydrogenase family protein n=1 Tax=Mesorhizobium sp. ES1-6 TaxID=2876626 RepID=UPI001CCA00CF|nr:aldehyde dehydrogenase family protein [Mesorhizobium sp. ES1-6]MBZ9801135.1 aldehyde dehydrogenase family protein [Mesorhizobium sp. ES1-6]
MPVRTYTQFIGGQPVDGPGRGTIERRSPSSGLPVARYCEGTTDDVDLAVDAARAAFEEGPWPRLSGMERAVILNRLAGLIHDNRDRLVQIEVEEAGKPIRFARGDLDGAVGLTRYAASLAMQMSGSTYTNLGPDRTALLTREPIGVVALVTPWNFPALIVAQKMPFALAAGCTVVLKPSEFTSGTAFEIAELATQAGIPAGVFNVVSGYGATVGDHLTSHPGVDFVSFTGSTRTGRQVVGNTARNLVKSSVELGGKSASIVFSDADLDAAVDGALTGVFFNNGECCISGSRLFVQSSIADEFVARVVDRSRRIVVGDPFDEATDIGALIDERHLDRVMGFVRSGVDEGAQLLLGGRLAAGTAGHFLEATIFDRVDPKMTIFREEIFGPVLSITRFDTVEDAVRLANDTTYGLSNYVWSKNIDTVLTVSRRLKSGWVQANTAIDGAPQLPLTGVKGSGFGYEMGQAGFEEFTQLKTLLIHTGPRVPVFRN